MPNYRRSRHGSTFFFTVVAHQRRPVLCDAPVRRALREVLIELRLKRSFHIEAWVQLPDHLHCIWTLPSGDTDYPARWGWIKKEVTKRARDEGYKVSNGRASIWQRRYWEHTIRDSADFNAHVDYIHFNPVKHRLVPEPSHWPWSTFHRFAAKGIYPEGWGTSDIRFPDHIGNE